MCLSSLISLGQFCKESVINNFVVFSRLVSLSSFELIKKRKKNETFELKKKISEKRPVSEESKPTRRSPVVTNEPSVKRQKRDENELVKYIDPNAEEIIVAQTINSLGKRKMVFGSDPLFNFHFHILEEYFIQSSLQITDPLSNLNFIFFLSRSLK